MLRFDDISSDTLRANWSEQTTGEAAIAMLAIVLCLLIGQLTGHLAAGAIAAGGAFTTGFAVFFPVLGSRLISMAMATLGIATATFAGSLSARWTVAVLIVVAISGLNYGLLSGLGVSAGWIGQQSAVYLVIATYFPNGPRYAAGRAAMLLLGGLLQMLVHGVVHWRARRSARAPAWDEVVARLKDYGHRAAAQMAWGNDTIAYAIRLVVTMVLATAIYRQMQWANGYWVPMTALLVLKPQWTGTISRSSARVLGTITGAAIAYGLAHVPHFPFALIGLLAMLAGFGCYALQAVNYALFSVVLTLYIVFLFRFGGFSETYAAHLRLVNTAIGGGLALLIDSVWFGLARAFGLTPTPMHPTDANAGPVPVGR